MDTVNIAFYMFGFLFGLVFFTVPAISILISVCVLALWVYWLIVEF